MLILSFGHLDVGLRLGGLYVFGPGDQGLVFAHREETVGKEADVDQVRARACVRVLACVTTDVRAS